MLTVGKIDLRVPINQTIAARSYLQRNNVESRLPIFHGTNHWFMNGPDAGFFWEEVHAWLGKHLK
jgi:dipeptidyl aminopeptidase/acylaminoacyl peptidase